ncbi:peptidoglycan DD-metalloendopeptidase family protein [Alisedimentitalea sp. MJ-SS2]|uniref:murein hydrolase activator EnvC family protein n=1 Tax=Aliisedimentitalea sp. MJ-SS2 TaxID=3049795 RepID=UPI0029102B85|nr:peptidoglycan DD-metalloendopeptidase family protein [Alisedimentitalea sp. MJ-SS2]MDU8929562.1 peptidoglycan DD-metalloendopeptidase family protein [Alisedimentitalea sp. MJ-SS2]
MILRAALLGLLLSAAPLVAQGDAGDAARKAAVRLDKATQELDRAESARDRVKALSETIRAFEDGLAAMRDGLRQASIREQALSRELRAREDEIAQLLGVLQSAGDQTKPTLLLHPSGPTGTARAGMILTDVTPALNERVAELRAKLEEVTTLRKLQDSAAETLQGGLTGVQSARTALSQAVADRKPLPQRFTEDPVKTALLISSTETLEGFASGLSQIAVDEATGSLPDISHRKGALALPVQGRLLRGFMGSDAAGITRPGIIVATRPRALVSTPAAATIRYHGPLLDYGNVMILEPQSGLLFVVAGLDVVYGQIGQVLPAGSPIGLMGGQDPEIGEILTQSSEGAGHDRTETLYIEVRENNTPTDPAVWFSIAKDE